MPSKSLTRVRYEIADPADRRFTVRRLERAERNVARAIQGLFRDTYAQQFEGQDGVLPAGHIGKFYNPNSPLKNAAQLKQMQLQMGQGSQYWFSRDPSRTNELLGLAKITVDTEGNAVLDDLLVHPLHQGRSYGRILAHAALKFSGAASSLRIDGYVDEPAMGGWYKGQLGLLPLHDQIDPVGLKLGDYNLPQMPYTLPENETIDDVLQRMEARDPRLTSTVVA